MDSRELAEWMAYSALEPWGEDRDDLRHSITAATISRGLGLRLADPLALYPAGRATEPPEQPMQPKQQSQIGRAHV